MAARKKSRVKYIPQRTCVACGETTAKRNLVRLVSTAEEGVQVDLTGKRAGRGAYLCHRAECWQKASQSNVLARALHTELTSADRERLKAAAPPFE